MLGTGPAHHEHIRERGNNYCAGDECQNFFRWKEHKLSRT